MQLCIQSLLFVVKWLRRRRRRRALQGIREDTPYEVLYCKLTLAAFVAAPSTPYKSRGTRCGCAHGVSRYMILDDGSVRGRTGGVACAAGRDREGSRARAKWTVWLGRRERARVCGYSKHGWRRGYARVFIYIYLYGWVRRSIHTAALHQNDRKHGVFIPGAKDKNVDSINRPRSPLPRAWVAYERSAALHPFDDAPKSCVAAEEAIGDAHTAGTRWW